MTKEEAIKFLTNKKVYVNGKSKEIQEKLFELGFQWKDYEQVCNIEAPFLFISDNLITYAYRMTLFKNQVYTEISAEDILSIKIEEEYPFKPFDKVLVRDSQDFIWKPNIFGRYYPNASDLKYYMLNDECFRYCIPYEGNEHLAFTTKDE